MSDAERELLKARQRSKATPLSADELPLANVLEANGLVLIVRNTTDAIAPRGRHKLATIEIAARPEKKPFGFIE